MMFSCTQLHDATDNYSEAKLIGKGHVFKGGLRHLDVAIKLLNTYIMAF